MTASEMLAAGRALTPEQVQNDLRGLMADPRFAAVMAWLDANREGYVRAVGKQALAGTQGALAHCAGSIHAVNVLVAQLANLIQPGAAQGGETEPEESQ